MTSIKTRKTVQNTAKTGVRPDWVMGGNPAAIVAQEARGQDQVVNSQQLPVDVHGDRAALEAAGVQFGNPLKSDPLFCNAVLPEGWKKQATEHSMWSDLVDAKGRIRARIFYKAAFYDRCASMDVSDDAA